MVELLKAYKAFSNLKAFSSSIYHLFCLLMLVSSQVVITVLKALFDVM